MKEGAAKKKAKSNSQSVHSLFCEYVNVIVRPVVEKG